MMSLLLLLAHIECRRSLLLLRLCMVLKKKKESCLAFGKRILFTHSKY